MEAYVLDKNYNALSVIDTFQSFLWVDRFLGDGDFEIYIPLTSSDREYLIIDNYIAMPKSDRYMVIEDIEIKSDPESGTFMIVSGRSLEAILHRRIIWTPIVISGNLQDGIERILNENVINPSSDCRKIPNFRFQKSEDPVITSLTLETQLLGEDVFEAIKSICEEKSIGFRVLPEGEGGFVFELYYGTDRSYDQNTVPWVVFSPQYDNLYSSDFVESWRSYKTVTLVAGEDVEDKPRTYKEVRVDGDAGNSTGLDRREMFTDAGDIRSTIWVEIEVPDETDEDDEDTENPYTSNTSESDSSEEVKTHTERTEIDNPTYQEELEERGKEELAEVSDTAMFDGEIQPYGQFIYGRDFFIGDIVQILDQFEMTARSRVTEVIYAQDTSDGETVTPTFTTI